MAPIRGQSASRRSTVTDLRELTDKLIDATHIGEPWQISAAQRAWDEAFDGLLAELRQVRLERDDFEQRLHAYKRGERV